MKNPKLHAVLAIFFLTLANAVAFDHSHAAFTAILQKNVVKDKVNYAALNQNPAPLKAYLDDLAAVSKPAFQKWTRAQQMAYLINLYNASTLQLIVDHYPVKSIKDIGGFFKGPWKQKSVRLFGRQVTLDYLEHDFLRPNYKDARIHFAVNCASIGCPALRPEAYQATKLDSQLTEQGRLFLQNQSKNRLDASHKRLYLSPIFKWYREDFVAKSGSVEKFILPYLSAADRQVVAKGGLSLKYTDYDWNLNKQ